MRIIDSLTYLSTVHNSPPERMILIQRFSDNNLVAHHCGCLRGYARLQQQADAVGSTTHQYGVYLMDEEGPQPPCRRCNPMAYGG